MEILLVLNTEIYLKVIKKIFIDIYEYSMEISMTTKESMELLDRNKYDLLILDVDIEGNSGRKVIDFIRSRLNDKATYIIAVTQDNSEEIVSELYSKEVDYCISKPFDPVMLKLLADRIKNRLEQFHCEYRGE